MNRKQMYEIWVGMDKYMSRGDSEEDALNELARSVKIPPRAEVKVFRSEPFNYGKYTGWSDEYNPYE